METADDMLEAVDRHLATWDRFACGANDLVPTINAEAPTFFRAMVELLGRQDPRAAGRLVFFAVVQVGGSVPVESNLGRAAAGLLGGEFPVTTTSSGKRVYFAADLFTWWEANRNRFEPFALLDEWLSREFATKTVLPMYRRMKRPG